MKAIALTQPWATLVAVSAKTVETRAWGTAYRGPLAIWAAKGLAGLPGPGKTQDDLATVCWQPHFREALTATHEGQSAHRVAANLPRGAFVAVGLLTQIYDAVETRKALAQARDEVPSERESTERELAFGNYGAGRKAWMLTDVHGIEALHPAKGAIPTYQGLFDLPREIVEDIHWRLAEQTGMVACWHEYSPAGAAMSCVQCALEFELAGIAA